MFITAYKLNNSYTTYVIHDYLDDENNKYDYYQKRQDPLEWRKGTSVIHNFHGKGVISSISQNLVVVHFKNSKIYRKQRDIRVGFEFKNKPSEIESLYLCH